MPLHGKIVVIKRSGGDGTEFPITASCLFGRKPDCDIRIQLPQVSKEHCRIDLNENKEVMLTNLSLVNPTRINGDAMKQAQHLRHGDVITIIDRSFRFEYPPEPTPKKKRPSLAGKGEKLPLENSGTLATGERRKSGQISDSSCLKDGTNTNVQSLAIKDCEDAAKEVEQTGLEQKTPSEKESRSPFCELYQIVKQNLSMKSPWKPAKPAELAQPLLSRCEPTKVVEVKTTVGETGQEESAPQDGQSTPLPKKPVKQKRRSSVGCVAPTERDQAESSSGGEATPKSTKRRSSKVSSEPSLEVSMVIPTPAEGHAGQDPSQLVATPSKATPKGCGLPPETSAELSVPEEKGTPTSQKKHPQGTPQKFSASEVARQIVAENSAIEENAGNSKTPKGRRSMGSKVLCQNSPGAPSMPIPSDSHDASSVTQVQCVVEAETSEAKKSPNAKESASPRRVSPRKSPGKKLQASDVLRELELTAPPSGGKSVKAGTLTSAGKKRKSEKLERDLTGPQLKRKRVSFGGQLSPELFDKRLPPNSPLRKGATPGRRSLSVLRQSLLKGSTAGLIEELRADVSSPKSKTPPRSPGKKASPKTPSPKNGGSSPKSPKTKAKTPSPKRVEAKSSPGQKPAAKASSNGKQSPATEDPMVPKGRKSVSPNAKTPQTPSSGKTPVKQLSKSLQESPVTSKRTPSQPVLADAGSPSVTNLRRRKSASDALKMSPGQSPAEMPKTPLPADKDSDCTAKTPSPKGMSLNERSFDQMPSVKGRFSISRISTPSPVADQDAGAVETSACATPSLPLRWKSMKSTSKRTPKSASKSVLEVVRSRRSGASKANLKVVRSWAEIVKLGVSKPQTTTTTKKCTRKAATVKKTVVKKLKTPARKVKDHFSTGHAASPATIVVGKAHTKVAQTAGFAPKIVHNIALLKKNMTVDEDLSGIAEIFRTPANVLKREPTSESICPESPQAASPSCIDFTESLLKTPEEMGEMVVSPLSVISPKKHGVYDNEAIEWLLQEDQDSSLNGNDAPLGSSALMTPLVTDEPEQEPVLKRGSGTPKQKSEPLTCLTGVKRLMKTPKQKVQQVEDLRGIKRLLKTPRQPKVPQEESLIGVKEMMKTPKLRNVPLMCTTGVKRLMKTPKEKGEPVEDLIGVKQLMQTPKQKEEPREHLTGVKQLMTTPDQKGEPVEDLIVVKQLMQTPEQKEEPIEPLTGVKRLMKTPKQKGEPVEDMIGVKRLMQTPKQNEEPIEPLTGVKQLMTTPEQKGEPVEGLIVVKQLMQTPEQKEEPIEPLTGVKRLMKTPKKKGEPVEDMIGVKRLMQTPKQKEEPREHLTGVKQLMKTPKQKGEPVEDMIGVKRLMQTPKQKVEPVEDLTGVKELMKTPKQKGQPVERNFGIRKLMKSPRQRGVPVEDFAGLQELMEEPSDYLPTEAAYKVCETSEEVSGACASPELENIPATDEADLASKEECTEPMHEEYQSNAPKKSVRGRPRKQVVKISSPEAKKNDQANTQSGAEMGGAGDVDQNMPEVKPKRGRQARQVAAPAGRRTRQNIAEIKEPVDSAVAVPTKCTRRRGAKHVDESEKVAIEENLSANVESAEDGDDVKSFGMEIKEIPAVSLVPANGRGGKKTKEIPQNDPATAPVRKRGRGRKANLADEVVGGKVESTEVSPAPEVEDGPEKMPAAVPVVEPRRGRKLKKAAAEEHLTVAQNTEGIISDSEQSVIGGCLPDSKDEAPVIKSGRGRRAKAVVKEDEDPVEVLPKRSRRGAVDSLVLQTVASPVPSSKSGRGRGRKAQNLDSAEEIIPVQAAISSTECSAKSPKNVRGGRRRAKISDTVALDAASAPLEAASQNAGVHEADKNIEVEANIKTAKRGSSKKSVRWNSDLMSNTTETGPLANSEEGSRQSLLVIGEESAAEPAENGSGLVEANVNLDQQTVPRRGRAGKKSAVQPTESAPVSEHVGAKPSPEKALPKRKGRRVAEPKSDNVKDVPIVRGGTKRKLLHEGPEKVTGNDFAGESVNIDPLPKRARGRLAKVEGVNLEEPSKNVKGAAKKSGKALDNEMEDTKPVVVTPKPARRGRRNVTQQDAVQPVPVQEECPAKKPATRGRPKTEKKADCARSEEAKPVRRTRQK